MSQLSPVFVYILWVPPPPAFYTIFSMCFLSNHLNLSSFQEKILVSISLFNSLYLLSYIFLELLLIDFGSQTIIRDS